MPQYMKQTVETNPVISPLTCRPMEPMLLLLQLGKVYPPLGLGLGLLCNPTHSLMTVSFVPRSITTLSGRPGQ
jgi:hypothetical protein